MTDATAVQMIKLFGNDAPRLSALTVNNMHDLEHYGNLADLYATQEHRAPQQRATTSAASEEIASPSKLSSVATSLAGDAPPAAGITAAALDTSVVTATPADR